MSCDPHGELPAEAKMKPRNFLKLADLLKFKNGGRVNFLKLMSRVMMSKKKLKTQIDKGLTGTEAEGKNVEEESVDENIVNLFDCITEKHCKW